MGQYQAPIGKLETLVFRQKATVWHTKSPSPATQPQWTQTPGVQIRAQLCATPSPWLAATTSYS